MKTVLPYTDQGHRRRPKSNPRYFHSMGDFNCQGFKLNLYPARCGSITIYMNGATAQVNDKAKHFQPNKDYMCG